MPLVLFDSFSVQQKVTERTIVQDTFVLSAFSAQRKYTERTVSDDTAVLDAASISSSPYVLPGETPTALMDLRIHVIDSV